MASIKDIARDCIEEVRDGMAYIAIWKSGRCWCSEVFWPEDMPHEDSPIWSAEDAARIQEIIKADSNAVLLCGEYHNLGGEFTTVEILARCLRWQYEGRWMLAATYVEEEQEPADTDDTDARYEIRYGYIDPLCGEITQHKKVRFAKIGAAENLYRVVLDNATNREKPIHGTVALWDRGWLVKSDNF